MTESLLFLKQIAKVMAQVQAWPKPHILQFVANHHAETRSQHQKQVPKTRPKPVRTYMSELNKPSYSKSTRHK